MIGDESILNPKLANIQNYPDGIKINTIPANIIPDTVYPSNYSLPYMATNYFMVVCLFHIHLIQNLSRLPENKYLQYRFIFPRSVTLEAFSFAFYNWGASFKGFKLQARDPNDNILKTLLTNGYLYTGGGRFGIKGNPDHNGVLPNNGSSTKDYIYDGEHSAVTDNDMVNIPNNLRISATE